MTNAVAELREHARCTLAPTMIRAEIAKDGVVREGYLINVSLGGALLTMNDPPPKNESWELYLLLPWAIGECRVAATTVWHQIGDQGEPIGAGMSFTDVSDDTKQKLSRYLARFAELSEEVSG